MFRRYLLPWLVLIVYRTWSATWRITIVETPAFRASRASGLPQVFAHWHRDELAVLPQAGAYHIATMTSKSKDGQLIDFVVRKFGGLTAKGSSSSGGSGALRELIKLVALGASASFAVDGPRGPIFKSKPGVFELRRLTGGVIIPVGIASQGRFIFKRSWNRARLPKLFSRVVVVFAEPFLIQDETELGSQCPLLAARLDQRITEACTTAEAHGFSLLKGVPLAAAGGFGAS
ncbi:MAG: DUF374 domain-containing protein [Rariglobus sp.]